jgi:hypothetical protein
MPCTSHCACVYHSVSDFLQRALEDGLFSIEDEDGLSRPNMTAVLVAAKQVRISMSGGASRFLAGNRLGGLCGSWVARGRPACLSWMLPAVVHILHLHAAYCAHC